MVEEKLILEVFVFDDFQRLGVGMNPNSFPGQLVQSFDIDVFDFDSQDIEITAKVENILIIPKITLYKIPGIDPTGKGRIFVEQRKSQIPLIGCIIEHFSQLTAS